jgi:hypothetical protein
MLDIDDDAKLAPFDWESIPLKPQLPKSFSDFFSRTGPCPVHATSKRSYARLYLRRHAILTRPDGPDLAVYTLDVSHKGIGILTPVQLLPMHFCFLRLATTGAIPLEIVRCRRVDHQYYVCGATFVKSQAPPISLRELS